MDRRRFLKTLGLTGVSTLTGVTLSAHEATESPDKESNADREPFGILVDTTECAGCRYCEEVCAEAHGLPVPDTSEETPPVRDTSETAWCVVNRYEGEDGSVFARKQCMHCLEPACVSACLTKAMVKTKEGPVIWREDKCMGCRFCMISCPFDIPKFEYDSPNPRIQKCRMCWERVREGDVPACVDNCPAEALVFGKRSELIREARKRIVENPDTYVDAIYGEDEAGGTGWLYLSSVPFEKLGFRPTIGTSSYPRLTESFLYGVPFVLTLWPAFLLALSKACGESEAEKTSSEESA